MKKIYTAFFFILFSAKVFSQGEANNWCFGDGAGLDFSSGSPVAYSVPTSIFTSEGCATISDASGNLLFYTDGSSCWDKNHNMMPSVSYLGGNGSSTQSAIIVKQPGSATLYYIFTVDAQAGIYGGSGGLNYSIVDMSLNGGLGDVTTQNVLMVAPTTEKVTVTSAANGTDYWVVTHEWNNNSFAAFKLSSSGLNMTPVISSSGSVHQSPTSSNDESIGYMKISSDGNLLGLACYESLNIFELFSFDKSSGMVTGLICSDSNFPNNSGISGPYGFSFSPDLSKAYVGYYGIFPDTTKIFQYDISSGNAATILASKTMVAWSDLDSYGALQVAVDQKIYIAKQGSSLDCISNPNNAGAACGFTANAVTLTNGTSVWGLPDFYEGFFTAGLHAVLNYAGCTGNDNLLFLDTVLNNAYYLHWDFGDPNSTSDTSNASSPTFNFPGQGSYNVILTVIVSGGPNIVVSNVITIGGTIPLNIGNDTTICQGTSVQLDAGFANATYSWSPSTSLSCSTCQVTNANPVQITTYYLSVTTPYCNGSDSIVVDLYAPTIAAAFHDTSICPGQSTLLSATGGTIFHWSPSDGLSDTSLQVVTATPDVNTTYTVEVDGGNGCPTDTATIVITLFPVPSVDAGFPVTITEGEYGQLSGSSSGIFNIWTPDLELSNNKILNPTFYATSSMTYHLYTTDENGCMNGDSVQVFVLPAFLIFPNAFSPNNDGINDEFESFTRGVSSVDLSVYNRWGQLVYFNNDMDMNWDGKHKEQLSPMGVYIYVAHARTWSGRDIEVKGNVTLLR